MRQEKLHAKDPKLAELFWRSFPDSTLRLSGSSLFIEVTRALVSGADSWPQLRQYLVERTVPLELLEPLKEPLSRLLQHTSVATTKMTAAGEQRVTGALLQRARNREVGLRRWGVLQQELREQDRYASSGHEDGGCANCRLLKEGLEGKLREEINVWILQADETLQRTVEVVEELVEKVHRQLHLTVDGRAQRAAARWSAQYGPSILYRDTLRPLLEGREPPIDATLKTVCATLEIS